MTAKPLYQADGKKIYQADIEHALKKAGVKSGDTILVHSSLTAFGKLCPDNKESMDTYIDFLMNSIVNAMKKCVGTNGTILMPTFSWSFCKKRIFDVTKTPSEVGALTNYFRNLPGVSRSLHAIYSFAVLGRKRGFFMDVGKDSFGKDSIFDKINKIDGKIIFFGAPFHSATFVHYIEQQHGIPYRFIKSFGGIIKRDGNVYEDKFTFNVKYKRRPAIIDLSRTEKFLLGKRFMKEVKLGNGRVLSVGAADFYNSCYAQLDKNIYYFLKEKPKRRRSGYF